MKSILELLNHLNDEDEHQLEKLIKIDSGCENLKFILAAYQAILKGQLRVCNQLLSKFTSSGKFVAFYKDTIQMRLFALTKQWESIQKFQIKWQNYIDKFPKNYLNNFFIGHFYLVIGIFYSLELEFETSNRFFLKSIRYFKLDSSSDRICYLHLAISFNFIKLGNFSDALHHVNQGDRIVDQSNYKMTKEILFIKNRLKLN